MFGLALHGGAGTLPKSEMSSAQEERYRAGLALALSAGYAVLEGGGSCVEAVTRSIVALEDDPSFNAGRGAVFTLDGRHELDASIMEGSTRAAGAVCGLTNIKNPILLARAVMEKSDFVFLNGAGAEEFAAAQGLERVPPEYFHTAARWHQLERIRAGDASISALTISHVGTVGAVALDSHGRLAAGTSTGGMTGKRYGRIGDSPVIGAGTYADDRCCAVSCTGHGEIFIRAAVAHEITARMRHGGLDLGTAVREVVLQELVQLGGEGGCIAIDRRGEVCMEFNSEGMFRACRTAGGTAEISIYREAR